MSGIRRWPVNSPYKGPERGKGFHLMMSSCVSLSSCGTAMASKCHFTLLVPALTTLIGPKAKQRSTFGQWNGYGHINTWARFCVCIYIYIYIYIYVYIYIYIYIYISVCVCVFRPCSAITLNINGIFKKYREMLMIQERTNINKLSLYVSWT